jgi:hypothetical protein
MIIFMATFEGHTVKSGVRWTVTPDSITLNCYPSRGTYIDGKKTSYKLHTNRSWKNECYYCKKKGWKYKGILGGHGNGYITTTTGKRRKKTGVEGQVHCCQCDMDCCGVTGKELSKNSKGKWLTEYSNPTPAPPKPDSETTDIKNTDDYKNAKAELQKEYKEKSVPKNTLKLSVPPLANLNAGTYIQLRPPLVSQERIYWIESLSQSIDRTDITLSLDVSSPGNYTPPNPPNPPTPPTPPPEPPKPDQTGTEYQKKWKNKGAALKNINEIKKWHRKQGHKDGSGTHGFTYHYFYNHGGNCDDDPVKWCEARMKKFWNNKNGNCVSFAWGFLYACKGANIWMSIIKGKAYSQSGEPFKHWWNKDKAGNRIDMSCSSLKNYQQISVIKTTDKI